MKKIDESIQTGQFKRVYLLYGEETYLKRQYRDKLKRAVTTQGDTMNVTVFEGRNCNPKEMIDLAQTLPFFADYRVILAQDTGFFKKSVDELAEYVSEIPDTSILIFVEDEVDRRNKLFKAVNKYGVVSEFKTQTEKVLIQWILQRLKREGKRITERVMYLFLARTGTDMENIDKELEKLLMYTYGREIIEAEDVEAICTTQTTSKIFDMVDAIAKGEQQKALALYYDLLALKEPPMRILFLIDRQFQILLQVKDLMGQGFDAKSISAKIGVPEFAVRKNMGQARAFSMERIQEALKEGVQLEQDVKTGKIDDRISVELMIVKYSAAE